MAKRKTEETAADAAVIGAAELEENVAAVKNEDVPESKSDVESGTPAADNTQRMYVGVSLPGVPEGTIFTGTVPNVLKQDFLKPLIIAYTDYPKFLKRVGVTTSREAVAYRRSAEYAAELADKNKTAQK